MVSQKFLDQPATWSRSENNPYITSSRPQDTPVPIEKGKGHF